MIDLAKDAARALSFVKEALTSFVTSNPGTIVSCVGLYSCPWSGWVSVCLDTPESSAAQVGKWRDKGPEWYGQDDAGLFNNNCSDFAFVEWRLLEVEEWRAEYEESGIIEIRTPAGVLRRADCEKEGDEAFNRPIFELLKEIVARVAATPAMTNLSRATPFRVGVQMLDSECCEFWQPQGLRLR